MKEIEKKNDLVNNNGLKVKGIIIYTLKENHAYNDNDTPEVMSEVKDTVNSKIYNESELIIYYCSANDNFIEVEREDILSKKDILKMQRE